LISLFLIFIISLANKQDRKGAIDDEDNLKDKLQIDRLKTKHKIVSFIISKISSINLRFFLKEFCTALPQQNNKPDVSIREGFSWLIQTIDSNYTALNSRVNNAKNTRQLKPIDRRTPTANKQKSA
jgi:hypothetical protein